MIKFALAVAAMSVAQPVVAQDSHALSLSRLLEAGEHKALMDKINDPKSAEEGRENLDWLQERWLEGNSAIVPFIYARILWNVGNSQPNSTGMKDLAAGALLYVVGVLTIDGAKCKDGTAPASRLEGVMKHGREILQYAAARPQADRDVIVEVAVGTEARTAVVRDARGDVEFMCRYGLDEMSYNLAHGTRQEVQPQPGQFGKQIVLTGDGKYLPPIVDNAIWRPKAVEARKSLPGLLRRFLEVPAGKRSSLEN